MTPEPLPFVETLSELGDWAHERNVDLVVIGATARDLALIADGVHTSLRGTTDVDVAVRLPDLQALQDLTAGLRPSFPGALHTFRVAGVDVDVVPFGEIEDVGRTVRWRDGTVLSTLGLAEAFTDALQIRLPNGRTMAVASVRAQVALKLMAWADRGTETDRDAVDLRRLIDAYSEGARLDSVFSEERVARLERYDFDVVLAGAEALGAEIRDNLGHIVADRCLAVLDADASERLPRALRGNVRWNESLLAALRTGLAESTSNAPT
jgi:predicted nucleotidyltransferase